jgi:hypothetical protein
MKEFDKKTVIKYLVALGFIVAFFVYIYPNTRVARDTLSNGFGYQLYSLSEEQLSKAKELSNEPERKFLNLNNLKKGCRANILLLFPIIYGKVERVVPTEINKSDLNFFFIAAVARGDTKTIVFYQDSIAVFPNGSEKNGRLYFMKKDNIDKNVVALRERTCDGKEYQQEPLGNEAYIGFPGLDDPEHQKYLENIHSH